MRDLNVAKATSPKTAISEPANPLRWKIFIVLAIGAFMALLDVTIVNVALPSLQTSISASTTGLEWIVSGYALSLGLVLIPAGRFGDKYGHRWTFIFGLALFTLASLACTFAQNEAQIVIARVVQGIGAGIFTPAITSYLQLLFQGKERSKAFSIYGAIIGISTALGPLLGGLLVQAGGAEWGWRLVFLVNVPIGVILIPIALRMLPRKEAAPAQSSHTFDPFGIFLLSAGLLLLLVPLIQGRSVDWPAWTYILMISSLFMFVALWLWELRQEKKGYQPLLPTHLLKTRPFAAGTALSLVYFAAFTSIFFTLSILWQTGLGHSALATGLMIVPFALGSMIAASQSHIVSEKLGRWTLVIGAGMVVIGLALVVVALHIGGHDISAWLLTLPLLIAGIGNGLFIAPNQDFILANVERRDAGSASGVLSLSQRLGTAIGIAVIGTVFFSSITIKHQSNALANGFIHGAEVALVVNVALALLALLFIFALPKNSHANR